MYYVYIIKSRKDGKHYVGYTEDLNKRILEHNTGKGNYTKEHMPWDLVYYEAHLTKELARKTELFYKTGQGRRQIKKKLGVEY